MPWTTHRVAAVSAVFLILVALLAGFGLPKDGAIRALVLSAPVLIWLTARGQANGARTGEGGAA